jgi:hypothetical protein
MPERGRVLWAGVALAIAFTALVSVLAATFALDARGASAHLGSELATPADSLYVSAALAGMIDRETFRAAYTRAAQEPQPPRTLAIADMRQPSTERRLVVLDIANNSVLLRTWVAHGVNSGDIVPRQFSNRSGSRQTSLGLYRVGARVVSPKHGPALLLEGLDPGVNDLARAREVIIHGADYVSERFIAQTGRLGRSWGCPAVPRDQMARIIKLLGDGGLLYIHGA